MKTAGEFRTGRTYHFFTNNPLDHSQWAKDQGATHTLILHNDIGGCGTRPAIIKKTVALIGVDENEAGLVWEKWPIKNLNLYN